MAEGVHTGSLPQDKTAKTRARITRRRSVKPSTAGSSEPVADAQTEESGASGEGIWTSSGTSQLDDLAVTPMVIEVEAGEEMTLAYFPTILPSSLNILEEKASVKEETSVEEMHETEETPMPAATGDHAPQNPEIVPSSSPIVEVWLLLLACHLARCLTQGIIIF